MKILILTDGIYPFVIGGMQKHSFYLAKFLALRGHEITLVHCVNEGKPVPAPADVLREMGLGSEMKLESIAFRFPRAGNMPGHYLNESFIYSKQVYEKLESRISDFDFIYAKGFSAWYLLKEKKNGKKLPPIGVKFHGYEMFQSPPGFKARLQNYLLKGPVKWNNRQADYIFSYGGKITGLIRGIGIPAEKIIEIPTGIESAWIRNKVTPHSRINFVFVGRYERRKGVEELTEALKMLDTEENFHFHFIGPLPATRRLRSENITYHGQLEKREEIWRVLDQCQVLVVPSHSEGMPNVIMEGMARGLAILGTDVGAVASVVSEANGWFVPPADIGALHAAMRSIIHSEPVALLAKQEASLLKVKDFFWEKIAGRTEQEIASRLR